MLSELIPLLGGAIFGGVLKLIAISMENKRRQQEFIINLSQKKQESIDKSNDMAIKSEWFSWTRRVIALSLTVMIASVIFLPMIDPSIPVNIMTTSTDGGRYLFGLIDTTVTKEVWVELKGIVLLPVVHQSFLAVVGCYFGSSIANRS